MILVLLLLTPHLHTHTGWGPQPGSGTSLGVISVVCHTQHRRREPSPNTQKSCFRGWPSQVSMGTGKLQRPLRSPEEDMGWGRSMSLNLSSATCLHQPPTVPQFPFLLGQDCIYFARPQWELNKITYKELGPYGFVINNISNVNSSQDPSKEKWRLSAGLHPNQTHSHHSLHSLDPDPSS